MREPERAPVDDADDRRLVRVLLDEVEQQRDVHADEVAEGEVVTGPEALVHRLRERLLVLSHTA